MATISVFNGVGLSLRIKYAGRYIDWLEDRYPQGFTAPHVTVFNRRRLPVADYDVELGEGDELSLVLLPGVPATAAAALFFGGKVGWAAYAIAGVANALIVTGLSYALNSIFAPKAKAPQMNESASASAVYNLSVPTNRARLGEPIPVIYGEVVAVPDLACQPYTFFNNGMWLGMILCLGQGEYEVDDLIIGGTSAASLTNLVYWKKYGPLDHNQTFGTIQQNSAVALPFTVEENLYVSPAVGGQQIPYAVASPGYNPTTEGAYSLDLPSSRIISIARGEVQVVVDEYTEQSGFDGTGNPIPLPYVQGQQVGEHIVTQVTYCQYYEEGLGQISYVCSATLTKYETQTLAAFPLPESVVPGSEVAIFNTTYQDGEYTVASVAADRLSAVVTPAFSQQTPTGSPRIAWGGGAPACASPCPGTAVVTCPKNKTTTRVSFDIVFPNGLYGVNRSEGNILNTSVSLTFIFTPIDDLDEPSGPCFIKTHVVSNGTRTPQRGTVSYTVPDGRYKVCVTRQTAISTSMDLVNDAEWYALKSRITTSIDRAYGDVTLIAVLMKASDGLASSAQNQVSVKCRRILPTVASDLQTPSTTKNPADAFADVILNDIYGANRPLTELDLPHLKELGAKWANASGWNGVFDTRTTVWEALSAIGFPCHAFPATNGAVISAVEDVARAAPSYAFTEDNIADRSLSISYQFDNAERIDGVEVVWRSPDDFAEQYALYPSDAVFPEQIAVMGLTDEDEANALAVRLWKQRQMRRQFCSFTTELEGHIPLIGEMITITHSLLGDDPTYWIAGTIEPQDEQTVKIEGHRYVSEIYE